MIPESRKLIYMGINYVISPAPSVEQQSSLRFQQSLVSAGTEYTSVVLQGKKLAIKRDTAMPMEIQVIAHSPQPTGQLLVIANQPQRPLGLFSKEVEAIIEAFHQTWPSPHGRILKCDATLRGLYQSTSEHAFKEIWEQRLHQPMDALNKLGPQVLGGGLRFVIPPQPGDPEPVQMEIKIESFLKNAKQIFIETQFLWPQPKPPGTPFDPAGRLQQIEQYIKNQVHAFMMEGE